MSLISDTPVSNMRHYYIGHYVGILIHYDLALLDSETSVSHAPLGTIHMGVYDKKILRGDSLKFVKYHESDKDILICFYVFIGYFGHSDLNILRCFYRK